MATERNMSSILAKLMGIDKPSAPRTMERRHKILSENYHQNIALIAKREKAFPHRYDTEYNTDVSEDAVECYELASVGGTRNLSFHSGRSFSPSSSSSGDRIQKNFMPERNDGKYIQERRTNSLYTNITQIQGSPSSKKIAEQIAGEVSHSKWHSWLSKSEGGSETEMKGRTISPACLSDSEQKHDASSFNLVKGSTSRGTLRAKRQLSERWRTSKCSHQITTSCGTKIHDEVLNTGDGNFSTSFYAANARYLSKPTIFPFAWVPRRRAREFIFDKNWCLRPGKRDNEQCNGTESEEDNFGLKDVQSTSQSSFCSVDLEKPCVHQAASIILDDSVKLTEKNSYEEALTVTEPLSDRSNFLDVHSPICHKRLDETLEMHLRKDNSVDSLSSNCKFALNLEIEEDADEENKKKNLSTNCRQENFSAKSTACILLGDRESWTNQSKNKSNISEPGSPVSSLEGPEACRHVPNPNMTMEAEEPLSISASLENAAHGLQRKLQLIETMSLESGSEGPEMVVSSDEGDDGGSIGCYHEDPQIMEIFQTLIKESMDFSYVVDVAVESGLQMRNLEMESHIWLSQGYALDPLVFDSLEKKYGKHMTWEKSERRLLFDRLNSGLLQIVQPSVGLNSWRKPVAKRFRSRDRSQELIEEELWSLLVDQQKELKMELVDKLCRGGMEWLDLEEETNLIVQEIQNLMMDELIEEFVCIEI